ncbi:MAG: hypothetical protein JXR46_09070 [Calditrichaceae bacterium]|nr:hypothetical protein [Calditrichaceae bacterium]
MRNLVYVLILFVLNAGFSQDQQFSDENANPDQLIAFNQARFDLLLKASEEDSLMTRETMEKKSGFKAVMFSALFPGAGQFYTENYIRAAIYAGLEIAFWGAYAVYTKKGDDVDAQMRSYADEHWIENKYWSYLYQTGLVYVQNNDPSWESIFNELGYNEGVEYVINRLPDPSGGSDIEVLEFIGDYDKKALKFLEPLNLGFTHSLPLTKTQQYYEMIYKYIVQFGVGWDDVYATFGDPFYYSPVRDIEGEPNTNDISLLTPHIMHYRDLRNESNDHYAVATTMVNLVLLNHLVSAIDAAFSAKAYNKNLDYSFSFGAKRSGDKIVNTLNLSLSF